MSKKNLVLRSFTYTVALVSLFVLTLGAVLIAIVVGDWIFIHTSDRPLSWFVGILVMFGFLGTLGAGVGVWLWLKGTREDLDSPPRTDTIDKLLEDVSKIDRD